MLDLEAIQGLLFPRLSTHKAREIAHLALIKGPEIHSQAQTRPCVNMLRAIVRVSY